MAGWHDGAVFRQMAAMFRGMASMHGHVVDIEAIEAAAAQRPAPENDDARREAGRRGCCGMEAGVRPTVRPAPR
jgi:hypothetical protein